MRTDIAAHARSFVKWLHEASGLLKLQIATAESLKEGLIALNVDACIRDLEAQQKFVMISQAWHDQCWKHWGVMGYDKSKGEAGLAPWLEEHQVQWEGHPDTRDLLLAWSQFRSELSRIQELNGINQVLVQHISEDTRRKLQALMEYAGIGNTVYTSEGDTQVNASNASVSGSLTGGGRLLAKG